MFGDKEERGLWRRLEQTLLFFEGSKVDEASKMTVQSLIIIAVDKTH